MSIFGKIGQAVTVDGDVEGVISNNYVDYHDCILVVIEAEKRTIHIDRIKFIEKQETKMKSDEWEFKTVVEQDIDYHLLRQDLTRQNPLMLITIGDKRVIGVHSSILIKSDICKLKSPLLNYESLKSYYSESKSFFRTSYEFSEWIAWAKEVKNAKWPDELVNKRNVKVVLPTI